jgi:hypothetical protein
MPTTFDTASNSIFSFLARAIGLAAIVIVGALTFVFAAAAAVAAACLILGASIALRFAPRPARVKKSAPDTLDARRTPDGWVVEMGSRRQR